MTTTALRFSFNAILVFLATWPLVQYGLSQTLELNPWKLFGLAMYSTVHNPRVELWNETREPPVLLEVGALSPATREAISDLNRWRGTLGKLVDVAPFAARILRENPGIERLTIRFGVQRLDTSTSKLKTTWRTYQYKVPSTE
jgi:hypothetical protein